MKHLSAILILATFFLVSCEEEPLPVVTEAPIAPLLDTTYINASPSAAQDKIVLFEEFTGVRCVNCPAGHAAIKSMQAKYPGRSAVVSIHDTVEFLFLSRPLEGDESFHTKWGTTIFTVINKPNGIPYGIADRILGSTSVSQWEANVLQQMNLPSIANAEATILNYDPVSRELRFEIKFELTGDINKPLFFSTAITEDSLIADQEYNNGSVSGTYYDYVHYHILRDMPHFKVNLNPGNVPAATKGRVFLKQYAYTLSEKWKPENCRLVAYIHEDIDVLQAVEIHIK